jgi:hypothetical protein
VVIVKTIQNLLNSYKTYISIEGLLRTSKGYKYLYFKRKEPVFGHYSVECLRAMVSTISGVWGTRQEKRSGPDKISNEFRFGGEVQRVIYIDSKRMRLEKTYHLTRRDFSRP